MFITIINDCRDENAMARQETRAASFFNTHISTLGVGWTDVEASGNIIDVLDASYGRHGIIMVNVAPRHGMGKKWPNGTPFGYFRYRNTLIISTVDGYTLSLAKKFGLISTLYITDVPTVVNKMAQEGNLAAKLVGPIINTQFRSFDYMPRLAKWITEGIEVPSEEYSLDNIAEIPHVIWWVDNFGNCKTTILPEEIGFEHGKQMKTKMGTFTCYNRLKDVPDGETALIIGSSGFEDKRFVEFVVQGKSAAKTYRLQSGGEIF